MGSQSKIDAILSKIDPNLKYEDLNYLERQEIDRQLTKMSQSPLTIEDAKKFIRNMVVAVEKDLVMEDEYVYFLGFFKRVNRKHLFLKAHLKCYIMIESFLTSRDRAKEAVQMFHQPQGPML